MDKQTKYEQPRSAINNFGEMQSINNMILWRLLPKCKSKQGQILYESNYGMPLFFKAEERERERERDDLYKYIYIFKAVTRG